jgi:hypothetical protein
MDIVRRAALAATVAFVLNALVRTAVKAYAHVPDEFDPFTWPPIFWASVIGVAGGAVVYAALVRFLGTRADRVFQWVAYSLMVLSFITPVTLLWSTPPQYPGTTLLTVIALEVMHVTTAVATVVGLTGRKRLSEGVS